jgi:uncharacterized heparinase superfamily protein
MADGFVVLDDSYSYAFGLQHHRRMVTVADDGLVVRDRIERGPNV